MSRRGGGVRNAGHLQIIRSTIAENAAVNELQVDANGNVTGVVSGQEAQGGAIYNTGTLTLERSTISGNQSEFYGGAIYDAGPAAAGSNSPSVTVTSSTIAENQAEQLPGQLIIDIVDQPLRFELDGQPLDGVNVAVVDSGDHIQFRNNTPNAYNLAIQGASCNTSTVEVPRLGVGLTEPLICSVSGGSDTAIQIVDQDNASLSAQITVRALTFTPLAHAIYSAGDSEVTSGQSIILNDVGSGSNCAIEGANARIGSDGHNLVNDSSCGLTDGTDVRPTNEANFDPRLGPLQDNNVIDFAQNEITGYTYSHALQPGSSAIDRIPPDVCVAAGVEIIDIGGTGTLTATLNAGDVVQWTNSMANAVTVTLQDGEANVNLVEVPAGGSSREVQFPLPGDHAYRVYDNKTRQQVGAGTIIVEGGTRAVDQRGTVLPQRGTGDTYACDIGAYEFAPWVVGQPLPRPPAALGDPPQWQVGEAENTGDAQSYHTWSPATVLDYPVRPSPNNRNADLEPSEIITVKWETDPDPAVQDLMPQYGVIEWPDAPQIHVSGAPVDLAHDAVGDAFRISDARAFEGRNPADDTAGQILSSGVFTRSVLSGTAGESYSVLQYTKGNQASVSVKVQVVRTVDWNTPGVRDVRNQRQLCEIGRELRYRSFTDEFGELSGHEDPEGKAGQILHGDAYDGVRTQADLARVENTVDGLVPPAHVRETREGPIIPILNTAPTQFPDDPIQGDHDLRVAWYRPDTRNVAWPVKTVGYRCDWPANPPEIVIASELGSEIGGQALLTPERFSDPTVYHQADGDEPGYFPNFEHALLDASNLGNPAPALYALRSDLLDRNPATAGRQSYALLKYRDPLEDNQPKIQIYKVQLTRAAEEITDVNTSPGTITLSAASGQRSAVSGQQSAVSSDNLQSPISNLPM